MSDSHERISRGKPSVEPLGALAMTEVMGDDTWQDQLLEAAAHWTEAERESLLDLMLDEAAETSQPARAHIAARLEADARFMPSSAHPSSIGMGALEWRALSLWSGYSPKQPVEPLGLRAVATKLNDSLTHAHRSLGDVLAGGFVKLMEAEQRTAER